MVPVKKKTPIYYCSEAIDLGAMSVALLAVVIFNVLVKGASELLFARKIVVARACSRSCLARPVLRARQWWHLFVRFPA